VHSRPVGPMQVRGRQESVLVYQVTGRRQRRSRPQINLERGLTPLVGRDRELELLHDCWSRAQAGRGQVVGIVGAAGVGKSRLLYEFHQTLAADQRPWLEGQCVAYGHNVPYLPLLEILRSSFRIEEGETPLLRQETLHRGIDQLAPGLAGFLSVLGELLGLPPEDTTSTQLHPRLKHWQTFETLRGLTAAVCQRQPHIMVLEDLHWLDTTTEEYLAWLIASLAGMPLLLITTYRPGYPGRWAVKTYYTQMALDLLSHQEAEALLDNLLDMHATLSSLKQLLLTRTEGNPFFLEESVRMLVENQVLTGEWGACRLGQPIQTMQVPATVQAVLAARIDRLPAATKDLLQTAAVIGKECPLALLQAVSAQPEETLRQSVAQLQAAAKLAELEGTA
jgi:predicted ATPase